MGRIILNFHGLGVPHDAVPPDERPYWLPVDRFARIVDRIAAHRANGRDIDVTFDDGNRSDLDIAAPLLVQAGIRASFFILTGRLDHDDYLGAENVRELAAGAAEIGLHGQDHVDWRKLAHPQLETETIHARSRLAEVLGTPVQSVSIPFGAYNRKVLAHLKAQGFSAIHTSDRGPANRHDRIQSRNTLRSEMTDAEIEDIMVGREPAQAKLRRMAGTFARRVL